MGGFLRRFDNGEASFTQKLDVKCIEGRVLENDVSDFHEARLYWSLESEYYLVTRATLA